MAANTFILPFRPAFDSNGLPVPGAKLNFYLSGTLTRTPVYANALMTTELSNPVIANSAGRFVEIYISDAITYRLVLTDENDVVLDDADPYTYANYGTVDILNPQNIGGIKTFTAASMVLGAGDADTPSAFLTRGANAAGTNIAGGNLTLSSGTGTGTGAVSSLTFRTPTVGASGATAQALADRMTINSTGASVQGSVTVNDEVYGVAWNGALTVPTKNAVYDKIEVLAPLASPTFAGDVTASGALFANGATGVRITNATDAGTVALGFEALFSRTTATNSTIIGYQAGKNITTGSDNVAIGLATMRNVTTGGNNVTLGREALEGGAAANPIDNVAIGFRSLQLITTGNLNTVVGRGAGQPVTTASQCTVIGGIAGGNLTTGNNNVFVGYYAGVGVTTGGNNTVIGANLNGLAAGLANTLIIGANARQDIVHDGTTLSLKVGGSTIGAVTSTGLAVIGALTTTGNINDIRVTNSGETDSVAVGLAALANRTTATFSTAVGSYAGNAITTGGNNSFFGTLAGNAITTGTTNVAIGVAALSGGAASSASENVAVGYRALTSITTGTRNIVLGVDSGYSVTTGGNNTLVGYTAGVSITTGSGNTIVGYGLGGTAALANTLVIGAGSREDITHNGTTASIKVGGATIAAVTATGLAVTGSVSATTRFDLPSYTVAGLPAVGAAGGMIFVSNEVGGATPAFSDGTNWRRVSDRAIVA